jgi:Helix-turn-helix domain
MPVKMNAVRQNPAGDLDDRLSDLNNPGATGHKFSPQRVNVAASGSKPNALRRMYTEEEVADMLHVSMSQLRKWRMKQHMGKQQGPPFKKLGRLVRYPEKALQAYIDGD